MTTLTTDRSLEQYFSDIHTHAVLSREEEVELAERYRATKCKDAANQLVNGNLRFVAKVAREYRGYGIPLLDLVQEGNMGLMVAIEKFDPARGFRLASYAVWWIRAYIQAYVMRGWSLVKVGTTQAQRKLFFRVRSERERADREAGPYDRATAAELAVTLGVKETDIIDMEMRLSDHDFSMDAPVSDDSATSHKDLLASANASPEGDLADKQMHQLLRDTLEQSMDKLNDKERYVLEHRMLQETPPTLQEVGNVLHVSRERIRQIECGIIGKLRASMVETPVAAA
jgi:RNA polymerase sigma-32 factor